MWEACAFGNNCYEITQTLPDFSLSLSHSMAAFQFILKPGVGIGHTKIEPGQNNGITPDRLTGSIIGAKTRLALWPTKL